MFFKGFYNLNTPIGLLLTDDRSFINPAQHGLWFSISTSRRTTVNLFNQPRFAALAPTHPLERLQSVLHDFEIGDCFARSE